jgi:hypothetical protein
MYILSHAWARLGISLYFAASVLLSSFAVAGYPVHLPPAAPDPVLIGCLLTVLHFILYALAFGVNERRTLLAVYTFAAAVTTATIVGAAVLVNVNYLRSFFHALGALYLIFLYKKERFSPTMWTKERAKVLYYFTMIIESAAAVWVLVFGYHGIILASSGAANWMIFNLYTLVFLLIALNALLYTRSSLLLQVRVSSRQILVDGKDYTPLLGKNDILIMRLFIRDPERKTTCAAIVRELSGAARARGCAACRIEKHKATLCRDYRSLYNQILKIKKFLETMGIGTILPPRNKMNVMREGWVLRLFEGVRLTHQA